MYISQNVNSTIYQNRFENIKNYILYNLGYPVIRVELTEQHLLLSIIEAVGLFYKNAAMAYGYRVVPVEDDNMVSIPEDINKERIVDVVFPLGVLDTFQRSIAGGGGITDDTGMYAITTHEYGQLLENFDMVSWYLYQQRLEDFKKLASYDFGWEILNNKIVLYPVRRLIPHVGIVFQQLPTDQELDNEQWIKDWAYARAKHILGTIRSKLSAYNAAGMNIAPDGDALKSEAKEEMTTLKEELMRLQRPMPFMQV